MGYSNAYAIPRYNPSETGSRGVGGLMTVLHPTSFPRKIHFHIKNDVSRCFMPTRGCFSIRTEDFESDTHITHFLSKCVLPKGILVLPINFNCMFDRRGDFDSIFMACPANSRVHSRNNYISLSQNVRHPPCKGRFLPYVPSYSILGNLDGV